MKKSNEHWEDCLSESESETEWKDCDSDSDTNECDIYIKNKLYVKGVGVEHAGLASDMHRVSSYSKFLRSRHNLMKIQPVQPQRVYTYYVGVFKRLKGVGMLNTELMEMEQAPSGSRVEDYFPMTIEALNKRGNWRFLSTAEALAADYIDFSWTNAAFIAQNRESTADFSLTTWIIS